MRKMFIFRNIYRCKSTIIIIIIITTCSKIKSNKKKILSQNILAELAERERSSIIIQNSSNPSRRKNLDLRPYDRPYKVLLLTCVVNCTAGTPTPRLCPVVQWSVHWAPSRTTWVLVLAGARRCALKTRQKKKGSSAFRLS